MVMGFKSKKQLRTCFSEQITAQSRGDPWTWDCQEFLAKTKSPRCLPEIVPPKCRPIRNGEKIVGPVYQGPRGGYFFFAGGIKIYVPKGKLNIEYAKKKYGYVGK